MKAILIFLSLFGFIGNLAAENLSFRDDANLTLSLSDSNFSRLSVKEDKITKAFFPDGALAVQNDEDGSLYVLVKKEEPFTLFLATEKGRHVSLTVSREEGLGKTVALMPQSPAKVETKVAAVNPVMPQNKQALQVSQLMDNLITHQIPANFVVKHPFNQIERLSNGIILSKKESIEAEGLSGEIIEVYNRSRFPITLIEADYSKPGVRAVAFENTQLQPYGKTLLFRVVEQNHG